MERSGQLSEGIKVIWIVGGFIVLAIVFGPQLWVRYVLRAHAEERNDIEGTGAELARHLLDGFGLPDVQVEIAKDDGDHYDPQNKAVRLSDDNFNGRSVTALSVAAHEVGHAIQDRDRYVPLRARQKLVMSALIADRLAGVVSIALSVVGFMISPKLFLLGIGALILFGLVEVIVHLITLPVEFDASFNKALPVLTGGGYLGPNDQSAAHSILTACALTYVASAAMRVFSLGRLIAILR